jgi:hypothetical protein
MKRLSIIFILFMLALSILACSQFTFQTGGSGPQTVGSGNLAEETREIGDIKGVSLDTVGELEIGLGEENSLRIEADDNILPLLESQVEDGVLYIRTKQGANFSTRNDIRYTLTVPSGSLERIEATASGSITAPDLESSGMNVGIHGSGNLTLGNLETGVFDLEMDSSGNFAMGALQAGSLTLKIQGSGNAAIAGGKVAEQNVTMESSGAYTARELQSDRAEVEISGSGNARIQVAQQLTARLSSSGNLEYSGDPQVDQEATGSGQVIHVE